MGRTKFKLITAIEAGIIVVAAHTVHAVTDSDVDALTTYAVLLGRASACGIDTNYESGRVGSWMDRNFTGREKSVYLRIFMEGMYRHAKLQSEGKSPDTCSDVRRTIQNMPLP